MKLKLANPPYNLTQANGLLQEFLNDFPNEASRKQFIDATQGGTGELASKGIDAWVLIKANPEIRKHLPSLTKVSDLLNNSSFLAKLPAGKSDLQAIIKNAKNPLADGTESKLVKLTDHLNNLEVVVIKFSSVTGFDGILSDLRSANFYNQDGITHQLNHMKTLEAGTIAQIDRGFDANGLPCGNGRPCEFDLQMTEFSPKYYEFKSYGLDTEIPLAQFKAYISRIDNLSELKYVFNRKKLSETQAKNKMKAFLKANAANFYKSIDNGGIGIDKCKKLFGDDVTTPQKLINKLDIQEGFNELLRFVESI